MVFRKKKTEKQMNKDQQVVDENENIDKENLSEPLVQPELTAEPDDAVAKLEENLASEKDKYLRLVAEFENYKKRIFKERIELLKSAGEDIIISILPVLDDFERAMKTAVLP